MHGGMKKRISDGLPPVIAMMKYDVVPLLNFR
jgi:hypothetical protein